MVLFLLTGELRDIFFGRHVRRLRRSIKVRQNISDFTNLARCYRSAGDRMIQHFVSR